MALLITPTILNSYDWYKKAYGKKKSQARLQLFNQLSRIYSDEMPITMKKGIELENQVYAWANRNRKGKGSDLFNKVCDLVKGGQFQKKSKKIIKVDGVDYCIYSKLDVRKYRPEHIIDIKTTANYKGPESYLKTWQHKFYCFTENVNTFDYIIVEWGLSYEIDTVYIVKYEVPPQAPGFPELKIEIMKGVKEFITFLKKNDDLWDAYYNKFCLYK